MGLCNSSALSQCGCISRPCCWCCRCASTKHRRSTDRQHLSPLRAVFNRQHLVDTGQQPDGWHRNLTTRSAWNSPDCQPTSAELSPLLGNNFVLVRVVESQPLPSFESKSQEYQFKITPTQESTNNNNPASVKQVIEENESMDLVSRSPPDGKSFQATRLGHPHPGLSDFWNELGHTLHYLRFRAPLMCEVSYKANCAPAARLFIPAPSKTSVPSLLLTPPETPIFSVDSNSSLRSPFAVRSNHNFVRVSSLREKTGIVHVVTNLFDGTNSLCSFFSNLFDLFSLSFR